METEMETMQETHLNDIRVKFITTYITRFLSSNRSHFGSGMYQKSHIWNLIIRTTCNKFRKKVTQIVWLKIPEANKQLLNWKKRDWSWRQSSINSFKLTNKSWETLSVCKKKRLRNFVKSLKDNRMSFKKNISRNLLLFERILSFRER